MLNIQTKDLDKDTYYVFVDNIELYIGLFCMHDVWYRTYSSVFIEGIIGDKFDTATINSISSIPDRFTLVYEFSDWRNISDIKLEAPELFVGK